MNRFQAICTVMILCFAGCFSPVFAYDPGERCLTAIPMEKDAEKAFEFKVTEPMDVWFSAHTFDLPLAVMFIPDDGADSPAPEVSMDFTCYPGYYTDSILCSLFCKTSGASGIDGGLPHKPTLPTKTLDDGRFVYYLSLGESYRDLLLRVGISKNLEVYVNVVFHSTGLLTLAPNELFSNCVDNAKFMQLGDTVNVAANDEERHVVVPYLQWQEDTIIYKWKGNSPCTIAVATVCDFDPKSNLDERIIDWDVIQQTDSFKVTADQMYEYVHNHEGAKQAEAGMFFAKFYSEEPGVIQIVKAKQAAARGNAVLLRYGRTYPLNANDQTVFAITDSWNKKNVHSRFFAPTTHVFRMQVANDPDFAEEHLIKEYKYDRTDNGHRLGILGEEMAKLWDKTTEKYLYIRFICSEATTITPERWNVSECMIKSGVQSVHPDTTFDVLRNSSTVYRFTYSEWLDGDMTISFSLDKECDVYLADTCAPTKSKSGEPYWIRYEETITKGSPLVIHADEIASWADEGHIDEDCCFYALFVSSAPGSRKITLETTAQEEKDPEYPASTIAVTCEGTDIVVNVSADQTIQVLDVAGDVKEEWNAEVGTPHILGLQPGSYTLKGKDEQIQLNW